MTAVLRATTHRLRHRLVLLLVTAVLLAVPSAASSLHVVAPRGFTELLSGVEGPGNVTLARDCGFSQTLPGHPRQSLWLFCDTPLYVRTPVVARHSRWVLRRFIPGSSAAVSPGVAVPGAAGQGVAGPGADLQPGRLGEVATPGGGRAGTPRPVPPAPFLPVPTGLVTLGGQPCDLANGAYAASWISGVTQIPGSAELLITFNDYCVLTGTNPAFLHEGFGLVEYDPAHNVLSSEVRVFSGLDAVGATAQLLGTPVFDGPYLYIFGQLCTAAVDGRCGSGAISLARVGALPLDWVNPLDYQWWTGGPAGRWTSDPAAAGSAVQGARPLGVSVAGFSALGRGFVLLEQTDLGGGFRLYGSAAPAGPWTKIGSGRVRCGPSRGGFADLCRAITLHPEFSMRSRLFLSYYDPGASAHGHVMVGTVPW